MDRNKNLITVFTPTYNRAYSLSRLYKSLCQQTCKDFEWLVVDDGSTDNTKIIMSDFIHDNIVTIRYIAQSNGGKHRAINRGVKEANGELFFIVDSDDWLANNAIERITARYCEIRYNPDFAGICGLKVYSSGIKIGGENDFGVLDCSSLDFRYKYNISGDMAEVIRTDILKKYPFPEFEGEKFCPEALIWNRIALKYKFRYFYERIYICEYLPDGLTAKIIRIRHQSPKASTMYYAEFTKMPIPFIHKVKGAINFWRFHTEETAPFNKDISLLYRLIGYIPGKLMRLKEITNTKL